MIKPIMKRERKFYLKIILAVYFIWFIFFEAIGRYASVLPTRDFTSYVDRQIPFIPEFVWPYVLCYVFPFLPLFVIKDWHRFNRALLSIILANLSAFIVYLSNKIKIVLDNFDMICFNFVYCLKKDKNMFNFYYFYFYFGKGHP